MDVTSNWSSENDLNLKEIIQMSETLPDGDLVDLLDEDKCISLVRGPQDRGKDCTLRFSSRSTDSLVAIKAKHKTCLSSLKILSEARVIEICIGFHEEYHSTVHGMLMGDFGDSKIYVCEVKFDVPQAISSFKLKGACLDDSVWIYGLHVTYVAELRTQGVDSVGSYFAHEHLSPLLKHRGVNLSKDADKFRKLLEGFNKGDDQDNKHAMNNPMAFMSMMLGAKNCKSLPNDSELDHKNGNDCDKNITHSSVKDNFSMSNLLSMLGNNYTNGNVNEFSSAGGKDMLNIHQTNGKDLEFRNHNITDRKEPAERDWKSERGKIAEVHHPMANIFGKLQPLLAASKMHLREKEVGPVLDILARSSALSDGTAASSNNSDVENIKSNYRNSGATDSTNCICGSEEFLDSVEKIVDKKLATMEERLLKRMDEKFERIEELLSKISERV